MKCHDGTRKEAEEKRHRGKKLVEEGETVRGNDMIKEANKDLARCVG